MSFTFTKLFSSITESTVWCEPAHTRLVWITMLAMADRKGRVWASVPGLANRARVPTEDAEKALETFLAPDRYSRTPDHDGRRIAPIEGGWQLLNHAKYRDMRDDVARREYMREYMKEKRKQNKLTVNPVSPKLAKAEAEADTENSKPKPKVAPLALPGWLDAEQWTAYVKTRPAAARKPESLQAALKKLEKFRDEGHDPNEIVANSLANGWRMLKAPEVRGKPAAVPAARPSIICISCQQRAFTWTGDMCNPCWRKSQGMAA